MIPTDMTADMLGIALGLGEEIAIDNEASKINQKESRTHTVSEVTLVPVSPFSGKDLVDLTQINNWFIPPTKRLRSPFIEKWKRVAVGQRNPDTPLLTYEEEEAYLLAEEMLTIDNEADRKSREIATNIKKLRKLRSLNRIKEVGQKLRELKRH